MIPYIINCPYCYTDIGPNEDDPKTVADYMDHCILNKDENGRRFFTCRGATSVVGGQPVDAGGVRQEQDRRKTSD